MIQVHRTIAEWQSRRRQIQGSVGFVPTMGALHRGHASLVERCRHENDVVVVSIFVNPTQFNDPKDLERYPRTLASDLALLEQAGADEVLVPDAAEMYPGGCGVKVEPGQSGGVMEGIHRPGHFAGVLTVVLKLLEIVRPDRAYFGEKDYQQFQVIGEMAREFFLPTEIVPCETVRAESGLAESSRNALLSAEGRRRAAHVYRALSTAASAADARAMLEAEGFRVEYVEEHWRRRFAAAFLEGVRLIDNVDLGGGKRC
jgi:pantoate--beta-alanine ligase